MRIITLLTDFGLQDPYVGIMKGVILKINPDAKIVDITHSIPQGGIKKGAFYLYRAYKFFPPKTIHTIVIDPGVGTERHPIIVQTKEHYFIGPDNGVFSWIYQYENEFEVFKIIVKGKISNTFHGRDVFAPTAAKLSLGKEIEKEKLNHWVAFKIPIPTVEKDFIQGEIIDIDIFGNLITNITPNMIKTPNLIIKLHNHSINKISTSYIGNEPIAIWASHGFLEIALPNGNAANVLNAKIGDKVYVHHN